MFRTSSHCCRSSADGALRYKDCCACCSRHTCPASSLSARSGTLTVQPERGMVLGNLLSCSKGEESQHSSLWSPGIAKYCCLQVGNRGVILGGWETEAPR